MKSLKTILATVGHDLKSVGEWVEGALKLVAPAATLLDPPIGPYITAIEVAINAWESVNGTVSAANAQAIATAVSTLQALGLPTPTTAAKVAST